MRPTSKSHDDPFVIVMSVTVVLGMAVALVLIFLWRIHPATMTQSGAYPLAIVLCPPFFLVGVVTALVDSPLAIILTSGTIVFANGSLYAGLAAFVYWIISNWGSRRTL